MSPRAVVVLCTFVLTGCELVAGGLPHRLHADSGAAGASGSARDGESQAGSGGAAGTLGADGSTGGQAGQGGSAGCKSQCDCDGDGAKSKACGGNDCDDHDPNVKPGQSQYFDKPAPNPAIGFDYNCNGTYDRDPSLGQVKCSTLSLGNCTTGQGFLVDPLPACGQKADWGDCQPGTLSCKNDVLAQRIMLCH